MDNKEIIEAISVLNDTLKTINPTGLMFLNDGSEMYKLHSEVVTKITSLTKMLYAPIIGELKV